MSRRIFRMGSLLVVVVAGSLLAFACAQEGIPQAEFDAVKQQATDLQSKLTAAEKEATELKQKQAAAPKPIVSGIPNAPPRPTATPTPVGFVAPPPPALLAPEVKALFLDVNTVTAGPGESKYNVDADKYCALATTFKRGMHIVWLMEGYDAATGKELQTADVKEAVLKLPHGENVAFRYGRHGATVDSPWFWSSAWDVPMDYPLGYLEYVVEVTTVAGKKETFKTWGAHLPERNITNKLTIIE